LLKEGAKKVPDSRKRRKISILPINPGTATPAFGQQQMEQNVDMESNGFKDITHKLNINKRNKTPVR
jgi:hypothetical protein